MLATVRNRRGLVTGVEGFDCPPEDRLHLVNVEYLDADGAPEDRLLWEREPGASLLEPTALPPVESAGSMALDEFEAMVRATRWTALSPYVDPDGTEGPLDRLPVTSPFLGAIQVEDFQLVPLLKALRMPRVSLLLADDVGLGKTIEAGLVLAELLRRRRVRRVLVLCPASLRSQWRDEMRDKFALSFDIVDRQATHALRKRIGLDANPWRTFPRVIASYDYLKQEDVLEQFLSAARTPEGSPHLPWDLLVVDEAHNLTPAPIGEDSALTKMLRALTPRFEHRLFLTATPHNGHTRSFTGLLEVLDPVRFSQKANDERLTDAERGRIEQVLVRRLKREINARSDRPRFAERFPVELALALSPPERRLGEAFRAFRARIRDAMVASGRSERLAGGFAVQVLAKRLLSCPYTFWDSWRRYLDGLEGDEDASTEEVCAAERLANEDLDDDAEAEGRIGHAARTVGAWLRPLADRLAPEVQGINKALAALGLTSGDATPQEDARFHALVSLIDEQLRAGGRFRDDERLIVFTEYKTTLDYLHRRLSERYAENGRLRTLIGGMPEARGRAGERPPPGTRDAIKLAFNDPGDPVRILLATDAAAEGLNLQETARLLLHFDVPWNPSRLEQRNGRLDRHGQARDVTAFHFSTDDDADLGFLAYVVSKVHTIREDLGSMGDVFDRAFERRLIAGEDPAAVRGELDRVVERVKGKAELPRGREIETGADELRRLRALGDEVDLDPEVLRETLEAALAIRAGRPRLDGPDGERRYRLAQPIPGEWRPIVDDALRLRGNGVPGALPRLLFDPAGFVRETAGLPVFRPDADTALLHLGHPIFQQALHTFARLRLPGAGDQASRWTVRTAEVPAGLDALLLITIEEMAINELRETFHHWVRTVRVPVRRGALGESLPHVAARRLRASTAQGPTPELVRRARDMWTEVGPEVRRLIDGWGDDLDQRLSQALERDRTQAESEERERFRRRHGEVSALIEQTTLERLEREIAALQRELDQGELFDPERRIDEVVRTKAEKEEEVRRRRAHYEELREQLGRERDRTLNLIIPRRYALHAAQVFPVAVEIRLPSGRG